MENQMWWRKPLRVIQPNLQVKDTARINPRQLASQLKDLGANTIVFNAGGIYAWYPTKVRHHVVNEYLDHRSDLLREVIQACHEQGLRFIARFDFSKADDSVFMQRPEWFVRDVDGNPRYIGAYRHGNWPLLLHTCINGGYRGADVAVPVLQEVLEQFPIDGVFLNAPNYAICHCSRCKRKYEDIYRQALPKDPSLFAEDWAVRCYHDNLEQIGKAIKALKPDVPLILYYQLSREESVLERSPLADMMCAEPHDVLSLGRQRLPEWYNPALSMKLGRTMETYPNPFGIIHSCPGMDWRHTGLPPAEHRFWMSQIPANGGQIWHSLTGIPDTITDKRILESISAVNRSIIKTEAIMDGAKPVYEAALIWNDDQSGRGLADGLIRKHILFDMLLPGHLVPERLQLYKTVILPEGTPLSAEQAEALDAYAYGGGNLVVEGQLPDSLTCREGWARRENMQRSEELAAAYIRLEGEDNPLKRGLEQTLYVPLRGRVTYCRADGSMKVLATLIPPFSPLESVGAPPERASLATDQTEIPLVTVSPRGKGQLVYVSFSLGRLLHGYALPEHHTLLSNVVGMLPGNELILQMDHADGVQASLFHKGDEYMIHLVNGVGARPLASTHELRDIKLGLNLRGAGRVRQAKAVLSDSKVAWTREGDKLELVLERLHSWECVHITLTEER